MTDLSIAVAVKDKPEALQSKSGDIIEVMPAGHQWGKKEVKQFLIVEVSIPDDITIERARAILTSAYYSNGVFSLDPSDQPIAKRRYNIDVKALESVLSTAKIDFDWKKAADQTLSYQPLSAQIEAATETTAKLDPTKIVQDKYENEKITVESLRSFIG